MKSIEINVPKNLIISVLLTLLSGVIVFDQIKIRKQEALLELYRENRELRIISDSLSLVKEAMITDSIAEPARIYAVNDYAYIQEPDGEIVDSVECKQSDTYTYSDSGYFGELHFTAYVMDSAVFVSHEITDTIYLYDWDTGEATPEYIVTCDTITGDCYLKMFR